MTYMGHDFAATVTTKSDCPQELTSNEVDYLMTLLSKQHDEFVDDMCHEPTPATGMITPEPITVDEQEDFANPEDILHAVSVLLQQDECTEPLPALLHGPQIIEDDVRKYQLHQSSVDEGGILPNDNDVLCGQSRTYSTFVGNLRFQKILEAYVPKYNDPSTSKQEKMSLTKEVVARINMEGGRFLKPSGDGFWEEISTVRARDKVGHALRTKATSKSNKKGKKSKKRASRAARTQ